MFHYTCTKIPLIKNHTVKGEIVASENPGMEALLEPESFSQKKIEKYFCMLIIKLHKLIATIYRFII